MINSSGIFVAATQSVGTAATLAGAGFYFHRRVILKRNNHQKNNDGGKNNAVIIDDTAGKKMLALISQQVTIPAFLFTKIVRCPPSIDGDGIEAESNDCPSLIDNLGNDLWMMLFLPFFVVTCGLIIGRLAAFLSATPSRQTKIVMATCAFANSTGLPITLLTVVHSNFPASTKLGRHDPTIFLSIYLLLYPVLQWGIGGWLLSPTDTQHLDSNNDQKIVIEDKNHINGAFASSNSSSSLTSTNSSISSSPSCEEISVTPLHHDEEIQLSMIHCENDNQITEEDKLCDKVVERRFLLDSDLENEHQDFDSSSLPNNYVNGDIDDVKNNHGLVGTNQNFFPTKVHSMLTSKMYIVKNIVWNALQPPIIAALLGIFILSIPSLRGVFVNITSQDKTAPLNFLFDGLCIIGQAAVPINMLILGINLSKTCYSRSESYDMLSTRTTIAIIVGKMIFMPIIGFILCIFLKKSHTIWELPDEIDDSVYLVIMTVFITPTANNIMIMVELSGSASKEGMATLIGWQYMVAPIILSMNVAIAVSIASQW